MTTAIKRRRGTTAQHATFTGLEGELTVDTTKDTVVVHDGATAGGFPLAKESQATTNVAITGGTITGITDLAIADGGTGASTAANARTNLGVTATGADTTYAYRANNLSDLASTSTARSNLGLGTIATQASSSVAITGGTIDGTIVGGTTRAAGSFTTITGTNDASISGLTVGKGGGAFSFNTAVGLSALAANTTGNFSTAFGYQALTANTTGGNNSAVGQFALGSNTTGSSNVAFGQAALAFNTTASNNTAVGYQAGYSTTTGAYNAFFGYQAGYTSNASAASGQNAAIGYQAGYSLTTGTLNTFVGGNSSGYAITTGSKNSILGAYNGNQGGLDLRTANNYIVLSDGDGSPRVVVDGSGNVNFARTATSDTTVGATAYTNGTFTVARASSSNGDANLYLYSTTAAAARFYVDMAGGVHATSTSITAISDESLKENIKDLETGLDTVMALKPRRFDWKAETQIEEKNVAGFIAQELEQVLPELVYDYQYNATETKKSIKMGDLVPHLVKAIQELKAEVDSLKQQLGK